MSNGQLCPDGGLPVGIDMYGNNICPNYGHSQLARGGRINNPYGTDAVRSSDCNECIDDCLGRISHCSGCHPYHLGGECICHQHCAQYDNVNTGNCDEECLQTGGSIDDCCTINYQCLHYEYCCHPPNNQCFESCLSTTDCFFYSGPRAEGSRDWRHGGKITSRRRGGKIRRRR